MESHRLKNGLNIVYEKPTNDLPLTSINIFVRLGSIYETQGYRGSSHFIEHICFKGTRNIPKAYTISAKFDEMGAHINAYTQKEYTCYEVKCGNQHVNKAIQLLSDMLMNSVFDKKDYELEKKVVKEENVRDNDNPDYIIETMSDKILFSGSSYEMPIDDLIYHTDKHNLLKYDKIVEIYHDFYTPQNMVFSIVSNLSFDKIKKSIQNSYLAKPVTKPIVDHNKYFVHRTLKPQTEIKYDFLKKRGIEATHIEISFRVCDHHSPDRFVLYVLSQLLGGTMSSRLFTKLREENGLTYESSCVTEFNDLSGKIVLTATTDSKKILKNGGKKGVFPLMIDILKTIRNKGIENEELTKVKNSIQGHYMESLEDSFIQTEHNGLYKLIYGSEDWCTYSEIYDKKIKNITREQIQRVIQEYLLKPHMVVCMVGENIPSIESVAKICETY